MGVLWQLRCRLSTTGRRYFAGAADGAFWRLPADEVDVVNLIDHGFLIHGHGELVIRGVGPRKRGMAVFSVVKTDAVRNLSSACGGV